MNETKDIAHGGKNRYNECETTTKANGALVNYNQITGFSLQKVCASNWM